MVHSDNEVSVLRNGGSGAPGITLGSNGGAGGGLDSGQILVRLWSDWSDWSNSKNAELLLEISGGTGGLGGSGESSEDEREGRIRVGRDYQVPECLRHLSMSTRVP